MFILYDTGRQGGNTAGRHQRETTRLTPLGVQQAISISKIVAALDPTHLIVSDRVRAVETGQSIAMATDLLPETNSLFGELCRPQNIYGHKHVSRKSYLYLIQWFRGHFGGDDCGEFGESYTAFRERLLAARTYLESFPTDARVVVVSHAVFISLFIEHTKVSKPLSWWKALHTFKRIKRIPNGSVTHLQYTSESGWQLQSFGKLSLSDIA